MGVFFIDEYDLYLYIKNDPNSFIEKIRRCIFLATSQDIEQDIKEFVVDIKEHDKYDFAYNSVNALYRTISSSIGVS